MARRGEEERCGEHRKDGGTDSRQRHLVVGAKARKTGRRSNAREKTIGLFWREEREETGE